MNYFDDILENAEKQISLNWTNTGTDSANIT